ncbi:Alpha-tocopherol transfer protein-like [Halotydeus destructor]|nr:Alpha-tocopherol transfer protein-like [Halotydeus destructor]
MEDYGEMSLLPKDLRVRAEQEFGEKDATRDRDIQAFKDILLNDPAMEAINVPKDSEFLLKFLRGAKFDYEAAATLAKNYYTIQKNSPELFNNLSKFSQVIDDGVVTVLPKRTGHDEAIIVFVPGRWNTDSYNFDDILAAMVASAEELLLDQRNQITGAVAIVDMSDVSWSHLKGFGPLQARRVINIVQDKLPLRMTGFHVINRSQIARMASQVIKPLLNEEITSRGHVYASAEALHQTIGPELLPDELGGTSGPLSLDSAAWLQELNMNEKHWSKNWYEQGYGYIAGADGPTPEGAAGFFSSKLAAVKEQPLIENINSKLPSFSLVAGLPGLFGKAKE